MTPARQLLARLVDEAINLGHGGVLDEICTPRLADELRRAFAPFRAAFPDWHQETVETVEEGDTLVARFRCRGTHFGEWRGLAPTGRHMQVDEVYFFHLAGGRFDRVWGIEDTWSRMRQLGDAAHGVGEPPG